MIPHVHFGWIMALIGFGSLLVSMAVFVRASRWRETDDAKGVLGRIDDCEDRITRIETRMENVATKTDVAELKVAVDSVREAARGVRTGVERIEHHLMNKGAA